MAFCDNDIRNHPEGLKILNDFKFNPKSNSDPTVLYLINDQFSDAIPTYQEFLANDKVKSVLGIIPKSKFKEHIGTSYSTPYISGMAKNMFLSKIGKKNLDLKDKGSELQYRAYGIKQRGDSDNYTYGLRQVKKSINIEAKIEKVNSELGKTFSEKSALLNRLERIKNRPIVQQLEIPFNESNDNVVITSRTNKDVEVSGDRVLVNESILQNQYQTQDWANIYDDVDGDMISPLEPNEFDSYNDFVNFKIIKAKLDNGSIPADELNQLALEKLHEKRILEAVETNTVPQDFEDNSDEIPFNKSESEAKLQDIIQKSKDFELTSDQKHYRDKTTGKLYKRVTDYITNEGEEVKEESDILKKSQYFGNQFDTFIRDYFDESLDISQYDFVSDEDKQILLESLDRLRDNFEANGEKVISKDIILFDDKLGIAGTVDLATVNSEGKVSIYDIKTMKGWQFAADDMGFTKYGSKKVFESYVDANGQTRFRVVKGKTQDSKAQKHQKQLSAYAYLLEKYKDLEIGTIGIIPIEIDYDVNSSQAEILEVNDILEHSRIESPLQFKGKTKEDVQYSENRVYELSEIEDNDIQKLIELKENLLKVLESGLDQYKKSAPISVRKTNEYLDIIRDYTNKINSLKDQIDELHGEAADVTVLFKQVFDDLRRMKLTMDEMLLVDPIEAMQFRNEINDKLSLYSKFILGIDTRNNKPVSGYKLDLSKYEKADKLEENLQAVENSFRNIEQQISHRILNDNAFAQRIIENYNSTNPDKKIKGIEELHEEGLKDLGAIGQYTLGTTTQAEALTMQIAKNKLNESITNQLGIISPLIDDLTALSDKLKEQNFDMDLFFEKDEYGETGNIISEISPAWYQDYYRIKNISVYKGTVKERQSNYETKVNFHKRNSEIIDVRRLSAVIEKFSEFKDKFNFSDEEIQEYENELRERYGSDFDKIVQNSINNFNNYIIYRNEILRSSDTKDIKNEKILKASPIAFLEKYYSDDSSEAAGTRKYKGKNYPIYSSINDSYLHILPKRRLDGEKGKNYYNDDFKQIKDNSDAYEYWTKLVDAYTNHINPAYAEGSHRTHLMSYAKIAKSLNEEISDLNIFKNIRTGNIKNAFSSTVKLVKLFKDSLNLFFKDKVQPDYGIDINPNYSDSSKNEISKLQKIFQTMTREELLKNASKYGIDITGFTDKEIAIKLSRHIVLSKFHKDITAITQVLLEKSAIHTARQLVAPQVEELFNIHQGIKNVENKGILSFGTKGSVRTKSNELFADWIDAVIKNKPKYVSDSDNKNLFSKQIYNYLSLIPGNKFGAEHLHKLINHLDESEKLMFDHFKGLVDKFKESDDTVYSFYDAQNKFTYSHSKNASTGELEYIKYNNDIARTVVDKQEFLEGLVRHANEEISKLGDGQTLSGIGKALANFNAIKSLAFNPVSGFMNRNAGIEQVVRMDQSGLYWTPGNDIWSRGVLTGANVLRSSKYIQKIPFVKNSKHYQNQILIERLLEKYNILQDKTSDLEKFSTKTSVGLSKDFSAYDFAVNNPEYKNQTQVLLNVLQDTYITHPSTGEKVKVFDGENQEFIFEVIDGRIKLKDEFFKNINDDENFDEEQAENNRLNWNNFQVIKTKDISKIGFFESKEKALRVNTKQSNFDDNDVIKIKKTFLGRYFFQFLSYMPEHAHQKLATNKLDVYNLITGNKQEKGVYTTVAQNSKGILVTAAVIQGLINTGRILNPLEIVAAMATPIKSSRKAITSLVTTGGMIGLALGAMKLKQSQHQANQINVIKGGINIAGFILKLAEQTANVQLRHVSSIIKKDITIKKASNIELFNDKEVNTVINTLATELGQTMNHYMVMMTAMNILATIMLESMKEADDEDDDLKKSIKMRLKNHSQAELYNFLGNQASAMISNNFLVSDLTSFQAMKDNFIRFSVIDYFEKLRKTLYDTGSYMLTGKYESANTGFRKNTLSERWAIVTLPTAGSKLVRGKAIYEEDYYIMEKKGYNKYLENLLSGDVYSQKREIEDIVSEGNNSLKKHLEARLKEYNELHNIDKEITPQRLTKILNKFIKEEKDFDNYNDYYEYIKSLDEDKIKSEINNQYKIEK